MRQKEDNREETLQIIMFCYHYVAIDVHWNLHCSCSADLYLSFLFPRVVFNFSRLWQLVECTCLGTGVMHNLKLLVLISTFKPRFTHSDVLEK